MFYYIIDNFHKESVLLVPLSYIKFNPIVYKLKTMLIGSISILVGLFNNPTRFDMLPINIVFNGEKFLPQIKPNLYTIFLPGSKQTTIISEQL